MQSQRLAFLFVTVLVVTGIASSQGGKTPPSQTLDATSLPVPAEALLKDSRIWDQVPAHKVSLNRTPPLYDTDEPASLEIPVLDARVARTGDRVLVQMSWVDATQDSAVLAELPKTPPETRFLKLPTEANDRFFDAAAVMFPEKRGAIAPSLQMGDPEDPVQIYYWSAARGPMVMQAAGRGTTHRSGATFTVRSAYEKGRWTVVFELPELPAGTPLAFAVWNGSQKDRDGRKYFSVWQILK
ncbi:MAG TPA: ethylbenzene dehydrogenase-related protein [Terriglobales bacterium]|nr:ethylbenzene dehydrogenase-related protein [Terriglobales bacterium]